MGKNKAKELARSRSWTSEELLELIKASRDSDQHRAGTVNPGLTHGQCLDILEKALTPNRTFNPHAFRPSEANKAVLIVSNVLREAA